MSFDFAAVRAPFRMQPGLRRLPDGQPQLTPCRPGDPALRAKLAALIHHPGDALLVAPGFDPEPALRALTTQAIQEHPDAMRWDGAQRREALWLGWAVNGEQVIGEGPADIGACLRALPAHWRAAALLALAFAEDFAVLSGHDASVPWLAVCLPSRWAPEEKIGRHFAAIHAPVADSATLVAAGPHLARLVTGAERWERFVWTIVPDGEWSQHPVHLQGRPWQPELGAAALVESAWWRTEHQSFVPVPGADQALFLIRIAQQRLVDAITSAGQAQAVHDALASMSPAVLAYRGLTAAQPALLAWLANRAAAGTGA